MTRWLLGQSVHAGNVSGRLLVISPRLCVVRDDATGQRIRVAKELLRGGPRQRPRPRKACVDYAGYSTQVVRLAESNGLSPAVVAGLVGNRR